MVMENSASHRFMEPRPHLREETRPGENGPVIEAPVEANPGVMPDVKLKPTQPEHLTERCAEPALRKAYHVEVFRPDLAFDRPEDGYVGKTELHSAPAERPIYTVK
jgi:hypothetical protein